MTLSNTFLNGLQLVSFPLTPKVSDAAAVLGVSPGTLQLAWWDPAQQKYRNYPDSAIPAIAPGQAYWLKLPASQAVTISGTQLLGTDPRSLVLQPGWNLVGNTYNGNLYQWNMTVATGSGSYTLLDALTQGIVGPLWSYNADGSYEIDNFIAAWQGGWMVNNTSQPVTLFQSGASRTRAAGSATKPQSSVNQALALFAGTGCWAAPLRVCTSTAQDNTAYLGVNAGVRSGVNGLDWLKPPAGTTAGIRLAFINPSRSAAGPLYATDIRSGISAGGETWEFAVTSTQTDQVSLTWPNLNSVPSQYQLRLQDESNNASLYLRTASVYQYQAKGTAAQPDVRRFHITVVPAGSTPPLTVSLQVVPMRGGGLSLQATPSVPATLTVDVRTPTGRLLRTITATTTAANQPVNLAWNGRAMSNTLMPSGVYLISLTAQTADGYMIHQVQTAMMRR